MCHLPMQDETRMVKDRATDRQTETQTEGPADKMMELLCVSLPPQFMKLGVNLHNLHK